MSIEQKGTVKVAEWVSQMAREMVWFGNKLGEDVLGPQINRQLNDPDIYSAIVLQEIASGKTNLVQNKFPTLYNLAPPGLTLFLRELGFIEDRGGYLKIIVPNGGIIDPTQARMELVHIDKPFVACFQTLSEREDDTLFNALSIRYDSKLV